MPFKKFWNLAPDNSQSNVLNMYVYGTICSASSFFGSEDDVVSSQFVEDLNSYPGINTINVYINSPGGSVFAAASIINQLRKHPACVHTWCDGICASAAVGILLAANPGCRHMSRATLLMIHNPSTKAEGDQRTFLEAADLLDKVKQTILNIYAEGTGLTRDKLSAMMDANTYLSADEALANNFIDKITEDTVTYDFRNDGSLVCNGVSLDVAAELNLDELQAHLQQLMDDKGTTKSSNLNKGGHIHMSFEEFLNSLEEGQRQIVQDNLTAQLQQQHDALDAEHAQVITTMQNSIDTLTSQNQELQNTIDQAAKPPKASNPEDVIVNSMSPEAQALLAQARADAVAATNRANQLQEAQAFAEFKSTMAVYDKLPLQDGHLKALHNLAKSNPDMFKDMQELLKVANAAMGAGFTATGTDTGTDTGSTAFDALEQQISDFRKEHKEASYNEALRAVLRERPELYNNYRDEMSGSIEV